jgi:hypothetical protein
MMRFKRSGCFVGLNQSRVGSRKYIGAKILGRGDSDEVFLMGLITLRIAANVQPDNSVDWPNL